MSTCIEDDKKKKTFSFEDVHILDWRYVIRLLVGVKTAGSRAAWADPQSRSQG